MVKVFSSMSNFDGYFLNFQGEIENIDTVKCKNAGMG